MSLTWCETFEIERWVVGPLSSCSSTSWFLLLFCFNDIVAKQCGYESNIEIILCYKNQPYLKNWSETCMLNLLKPINWKRWKMRKMLQPRCGFRCLQTQILYRNHPNCGEFVMLGIKTTIKPPTFSCWKNHPLTKKYDKLGVGLVNLVLFY